MGMRHIMSATTGPQEFRFYDATDSLGCRVEIYLGRATGPLNVFGAVARDGRGELGTDRTRCAVSTSSVGVEALDQRPCDPETKDFRGALVDSHRARLPIQPLDLRSRTRPHRP